jgi:DNA mismatch repair protein MutS2
VHLAGIGTGIVREARGADRYAIDIKGRIVVADARDLEPAEVSRKGGKPAPYTSALADSAPSVAAPSLDLHGRTADEAAQLVQAFVNDALLAGHAEIRVIHGKSGGRVKAAVHQCLKGIAAVRSFHVDPRNTGVSIVSFK